MPNNSNIDLVGIESFRVFQAPRNCGKQIKKNCAQTVRELERDGGVEPVSIVFNTIFQYTSLLNTL